MCRPANSQQWQNPTPVSLGPQGYGAAVQWVLALPGNSQGLLPQATRIRFSKKLRYLDSWVVCLHPAKSGTELGRGYPASRL